MNFVVCILQHDFNQSDSIFYTQCSIFEDDECHFVVTFSCHLENDSIFYTQCSIFEDDECHFVVTFSCHLGHVVYSDEKVTPSKIPSVT